jgi:hypothetical protein
VQGIDRLEGDIELQDYIYRKVRQAKTSERSLWKRVKKAFEDGSTDYDKESDIAKKFYALAQDKIHYVIEKLPTAKLKKSGKKTSIYLKIRLKI